MGGKSSKSGQVQVLKVTKKESVKSNPTSSPIGNPSPPTNQTNTMETVVAKTYELDNGQMKEFDIGDQKSILLIKENDKFYATGNKCTHYGAPLSKGSYCRGIVRCPWHGACFNVMSGDIEDFPGLDGIQTFDTEIRDDQVVVRVNPKALDNFRRMKSMMKRSHDNSETVILIGGGPSTLVCAETLRQEGFTGRVVLVSRENNLPYDRIKLSKAMNIKPEEITLRKQDFFDENDIEVLLGKEVKSVIVAEKKIRIQNGETLSYDKLVIGTGGQPRRIHCPGSDLQNIFVLRTPEDANAIYTQGKNKNVLICGSSFIGLEVASFFVNKASSVHVVGRSEVPLKAVFGQDIGLWFKQMHEAKGVIFHFQCNVTEFRGENGKVKEAVLSNGIIVPADVCILGIGVIPTTEFLKDSGITLTSKGYVSVNKQMQTNVPDVYAVGDITEFPLFIHDDKPANIQHWQMAHQHGRIAGLNIIGQTKEIHSVPYFWTVQYGKSLRYTGYGAGYDDIVIHGSIDDNKFVAFYSRGDRVVAIASLGWDPIVSQAAQFMSNGGHISKSEIKSDPTLWTARLCFHSADS